MNARVRHDPFRAALVGAAAAELWRRRGRLRGFVAGLCRSEHFLFSSCAGSISAAGESMPVARALLGVSGAE
jgi:hypothetical protein